MFARKTLNRKLISFKILDFITKSLYGFVYNSLPGNFYFVTSEHVNLYELCGFFVLFVNFLTFFFVLKLIGGLCEFVVS